MKFRALRCALGFAVGLLAAGCNDSDSGPGLITTLSGAPQLTIRGPGNAPSGTLTVSAGSPVTGFSATLLDTSNGNAPFANQQVTLTATTAGGVPAGSFNAPPASVNSGGGPTDSTGTLAFTYVPPATVTAAEVVTLSATVLGVGAPASYTLTLQPATAPTLTITGPANVVPGSTTAGYVATLHTGSGQAIQGTFVSLTPSDGVIGGAGISGGGTTDANGRVAFNYAARSGISAPFNVTISGSASVPPFGTISVTPAFPLTIQPNVFQFKSPAANANEPVGTAASGQVPLHFQWMTAASTGTATGIAGTVKLNAQGSGGGSPTLVFNGSQFTNGSTATVTTDATGDFTSPVTIFDRTGETVTISATNTSDSSTASLILIFQGPPTSVDLSPASSTISHTSNTTLTFTVLNAVNQPVSGQDVTFSILTPVGPSGGNEKVFPTGGTTDSQGRATTQYTPGSNPGTAVLQGCTVPPPGGTPLCGTTSVVVQ